MNRTLLTMAVLGALSAAAYAQESDRDYGRLLRPVKKTGGETAQSVHAELAVEIWRTECRDFDLFGIGIDPTVQHDASTLSAAWEYRSDSHFVNPGTFGERPRPDFILSAYAVAGVERVRVTLEADGNDDTDTFDPSFVWGLGVNGSFKVDMMGDIRGRLLFRSGEAHGEDGITDLTWAYFMLRAEIDLVWRVVPGVSPFLGLRFSSYNAKETFESAGNEFDYRTSLRFPVGIVLGTEVAVGDKFTGLVEVGLVDGLGATLSMNMRF